MAYTAWVRRAEEHPRVLAALATGDLPESVARILCQWTNRLPEDQRDLADDKLVAAALAGMSLQDLAGLYGEIYEQARSASADEDQDEVFDGRTVRLITTFQGAGVLSGDLTPECAEAVAAVLDALAAPAGAEDDRSQEQRYHMCVIIVCTGDSSHPHLTASHWPRLRARRQVSRPEYSRVVRECHAS